MMTVRTAIKAEFSGMLWLCAAGLATGIALPALGQTSAAPSARDATSQLLAFEVASIRPAGPNQEEMNGLYAYPGGRVVGKGCSVQYLIMLAFDVQQYQISGGPDWINLVQGDRFDIEAKPPDSSPSIKSNPSISKLLNEEQRQMLQSLLIERFQLKFHRKTKEGTVYILEKGEKEPKLQSPKDKDAFPWAGGISGGWFGGGIRGQNISMPQLAVRLSRFFERPVLDRTGLQGSFDFEYRTGADDNDADIPGFLIESMKGIGLKLEPSKGGFETIVIDQAEKPSAN